MIYWRNILLICLLSACVVGGFFLLAQDAPATNAEALALTDAAYGETMASSGGGESFFAALLGIAGLVYLKIIWKLVHAPQLINERSDGRRFYGR